METKLSAKRVFDIFVDCLFREGEDTSKFVEAKGIVRDAGFHPGRLENYKEEIIAMLAELPDGFQEASGGGMSFLDSCVDKHGNLWTGAHNHMEELFLLGIAIKKVAYVLPRETWAVLPGGMPMLVVKA